MDDGRMTDAWNIFEASVFEVVCQSVVELIFLSFVFLCPFFLLSFGVLSFLSSCHLFKLSPLRRFLARRMNHQLIR